ncbi:MAG: DUF4298 domain-containing protein [Paludibacteraceae bacterium]|nr:DUF4298 domain-containing protein [Paludibacteraceae bacterium]
MPNYDINRITQMEQLFSSLRQRISRILTDLENDRLPLADLLGQRKTLQPDIDRLAAYYSSDAWIADFEADEAGLLPKDMPRGVLSEDGVNDLLDSFNELEHSSDEVHPIAPMYGPVPWLLDKHIQDADNIIFDFGGVLMKHNEHGCVEAFNTLIGEGSTKWLLGLGIEDTLNEDYFRQYPWKDKPLQYLYERGEITTEEFLMHILKYCPDGTAEQQIIDAWNTMHAGVPDIMWLKIRFLRMKGFRTFLFSNTNELHWQHTLSLYKEKIETCFDDVFLSFKIGLCKPDYSAFETVDKNIGADPNRTFFIDDSEENRIAAIQAVKWWTAESIDEFRRVYNI